MKPIKSNVNLVALFQEKENILKNAVEATDNVVNNIDCKIANEINKAHKEDMTKEFTKIYKTMTRKGNSAAVFSVKEKILGKKKDSGEPHAIRNSKTGDLIFHSSGIKETSVKYCKDLLTNRDPEEEYVDDLIWKREVHNVRMCEHVPN